MRNRSIKTLVLAALLAGFGGERLLGQSTATFIPVSASWRYLNNGSNQSNAWRAVTFNDNAWSNGVARLGFGGDGEVTVMGNATSGIRTYYFRRAFTVSNPALVTSLTSRLIRDDGAVVYLNGTEVFRSNMPTGAVAFTTFAVAALEEGSTPDPEQLFGTNSLPPSLLVAGTNVVGVEVHQAANGIADLGFSFELTASLANQPPSITVTNPPSGQTFPAGATVTIGASASDPDGTVTNVQFFANGVFVGQDNTSPFSTTMVNPASGNYSLNAIATDNGGLRATSSVVRITVLAPQLDFGDAPDPYPTKLGSDGARHTANTNFKLGSAVDAEVDGQPDLNALGDDNIPTGGPDDEDGVVLSSPLQAGQTATAVVTLTSATGGSGRLDAWIDFNANGNWNDPGEQIFLSTVLNPGANTLTFPVPAAAKEGVTFARFRLSQQGGLKPDGAAPDGEVEDYQVSVVKPQIDFGDAPAPYPTLQTNNGARHIIVQGIRLGANLDPEPDGQPSATALGDDLSPPGVPDDEDGVVFITPLVAGETATVEVTAQVPGLFPAFLFAWCDFNGNGSWADPGEQIFNAVALSTGVNTLNFNVPSSAKEGATFARFRLTTLASLSFDGPAPNGEVEDYQVTVSPALDFGDAPDPTYPTTLKNNGARHLISRTFHLGELVDAEADGQPNLSASGDDSNPSQADDEDGVVLSAPLVPGQTGTATVQVTVPAGQAARLDAWIDFNQDGDWRDPGEQIFTSVPVVAGVNTLNFTVPVSAVEGPTFARFRLSHQGGLSFDGPAPDGEVEDYVTRIGARPPQDSCNVGCKGTDFWLTFPANYAPDPDNPLRLTLCILGTPGTVGTVDFPARGFSGAFNIPASMSATISVPRTADLGDAIDVVEDKGIRVTASAPVSVYAESHARYTTDGYLGLPTNVLGRAYVVQSFANVFNGAPDLNGSQFAIVACESNTTVQIRPTADAGSHPANVIYSITMNEGQTYQLRSTNGAPADLSGTIMVSDKPIAVFGSHRCANIPSSNVFFCDYIVEQLLPVQTWGLNFVTFPLATRANGDTFRFQAAFNATAVSINGALVATLNSGQSYQTQLSAGAHITSDKPISVMQYANSADFDPQPFSNGDPFMVIVPPTPMYSTNHMVCTAPVDFPVNFINVIAPIGVLGSVAVDGALIPAAAFSVIPGSGYAGVQRPVAVGPHQVSAPLPVAVTVYGWNEYDSYGWPGCLFFGDTTPPTVTCPTTNITVSVGIGAAGGCSVLVPELRRDVQVSDNCSSANQLQVDQDPAPGTPVGPGVYPITLSATDARGNVGRCIVTLTVLDPTQPIITCPSNIVVNCRSNDGAVVTYKVDARTACGTDLPVLCNPPSGSFLSSGVHLVTCTATNAAGQPASCEFTVTVRCLAIQPQPTAGTVTISWTGGGVLETTTDLGGTWTSLPNANNPFRVTLSGKQQFFRVRYN